MRRDRIRQNEVSSLSSRQYTSGPLRLEYGGAVWHVRSRRERAAPECKDAPGGSEGSDGAAGNPDR